MNAPYDESRHEAELIEALEALERGESVESVLRRHPASAEALRPALETAAALTAAVRPPTMAQVATSRERLLAAFDARAAGIAPSSPSAESSTPGPSSTAPSRSAAAPHRPRLAIDRSTSSPRPATRPLRTIWAMAAGVAALLVGAPVAYAATNAVPGDALYAVKEAGRGVLLATAPSVESHRARAAAVAAARRADVAVAMAAARSADVTFEGVIDAYAAEWCRISGLTVNVPADVAEYGASEHPGAFGVGDHVRIRARLTAGQLVAVEMLPFLDYGVPAPVVPHGPTPLASMTGPRPTPSPIGAGRAAAATSSARPSGPTAEPPAAQATAAGGPRPIAPPARAEGSDDAREIGEDKGGEDKGGEDEGGDDKGGEDEGGDDKGGEDEGGEDEGGDDKGGEDEGGEDEGGEDEGGDDKGGEDEGGEDKGRDDKGGEDEGGEDKGRDDKGGERNR